MNKRPAIDGRSPLIRRIDEIDTSHITPEPWFPGKWKARHEANLQRDNQRLKHQIRLLRMYGVAGI